MFFSVRIIFRRGGGLPYLCPLFTLLWVSGFLGRSVPNSLTPNVGWWLLWEMVLFRINDAELAGVLGGKGFLVRTGAELR